MDEFEKKDGIVPDEEQTEMLNPSVPLDSSEEAAAENTEEAVGEAAEDTAENEDSAYKDMIDSAAEALEKAYAEEADGNTGEDTAETEDSVYIESTASAAEAAAEAPAKKKSKKGVIIISIVAVVMVIIAAVLVAVVLKGDNKLTPKVKNTAVVMTVDGVDSTAGEFRFYCSYLYSYYYQYIMYGSVSEDNILEMSKQELAYVSTVYNAAKEAGFELSDDEYKATVTDTLDSYKSYAEENGQTLDEYLEETYGDGFDEEMFTSFLEKNSIATAYKAKCDEDAMDFYKTAEGKKKIDTEYAANKAKYDGINVKYYYFADDEDGTTAQSKADKLIKLVNEGSTFPAAIYNNFKSDTYTYSENECPSVTDCTYDSLVNLSEDVAKWAFETSADGKYARKTGDMKSFPVDSMVYVFFVDSAPARDERVPVTFRDILIAVASDADEEATLSAKAKADSLLKEYKSKLTGGKTIDEVTFAGLAKDNSADSSYAQNGGLHSDVIAKSAEADEWALDSARKAGDCAVVKYADGYHVLLFVEKSQNAQWASEIAEVLAQNDSNAKFGEIEDIVANAKIDDTKIANILQAVIDDMNKQIEEAQVGNAQAENVQAEDVQAEDAE